MDAETDTFVLDGTTNDAAASPPLPEDWFLRVAQTNPDDDAAITAAVNRFGSFGVDRELNLDGSSHDRYLAGNALSLLHHLSPEQRRLVIEAHPKADEARRVNRTVCVESKASIVAGIDLLKTMLDIWESLEVAQRGWQRGDRLANMLEDGLKAFAPRVVYLAPDEALDLDPRTSHAEFAPLLSVLVLQMAHAIANGWRDVRMCADDRCGKLFCRQEGRSKVRSPRNDSMFCTHVCARRFHQRNYRKQKRKAERE